MLDDRTNPYGSGGLTPLTDDRPIVVRINYMSARLMYAGWLEPVWKELPMTRTLISACVLVLVFSACKKKDDAKPAPAAGDMKAGDKASEVKSTTGPTFATAAEYEAKTTPVMNAIIAAFVADGTNCDKLASDLSKLGVDNHDTLLAATAWEHANPAANRVLAWSSRPYLEAAVPSINACKEKPAFADAMSKLQLL
ncbi:MAG: hypothetical protein JWO36_4393 [Myxococcales bacterium]|nr:hypothetical protein [Myxococcales bacterium]